MLHMRPKDIDCMVAKVKASPYWHPDVLVFDVEDGGIRFAQEGPRRCLTRRSLTTSRRSVRETGSTAHRTTTAPRGACGLNRRSVSGTTHPERSTSRPSNASATC